MVRSKLMIQRRLQHKKSGTRPPRRLNTGVLKDQLKRDELKAMIDVNLENWDAEHSDLEQKWKRLK